MQLYSLVRGSLSLPNQKLIFFHKQCFKVIAMLLFLFMLLLFRNRYLLYFFLIYFRIIGPPRRQNFYNQH